MNLEINGAKILFSFETALGTINISQTLVMTWIVMAIITGLCIWLGHDLKVKNISRRQAVAEMLVTSLYNFVRGNMGPNYDSYVPLLGALFSMSVLSSLISLLGFWSPTADITTEAAWAVVVFILITRKKIQSNGIGGYLKGFLEPIFIMAPMNVVSEIATPVSMAFRHFGNILSGTVVGALIYAALIAASHALMGLIFGWIPGVVGDFLSQIPILAVGIPAVTGLYFDWFSACIQAFIFCTLTTIFIKQAAGED